MRGLPQGTRTLRTIMTEWHGPREPESQTLRFEWMQVFNERSQNKCKQRLDNDELQPPLIEQMLKDELKGRRGGLQVAVYKACMCKWILLETVQQMLRFKCHSFLN